MKDFWFRDRLTGQESTRFIDSSLAGKVLVYFDPPAWINGIPASPGSYLLPTRSGKAIIRTLEGVTTLAENIPFQQFPIKNEKESLLVFGKRLQEIIDLDATWSDWAEVSPLVVSNLQKVRLNHFDKILQQYLWHLQEVSRNPRTQLTIEIERLPVGRARRIPTKAYEHLASHTEDWEYRKLTSVVPNRILSTLPDDLINFYENRLAARLIVDIFRYLRDRIKVLRDIENFQVEISLGTHQRRRRVLQLLAEAVDPEETHRHAKATHEILEDLYQRTLGMFDQILYQAIPPQVRDQVPDEVRATNILVNDRHYRFINLIWKEYLQHQQNQPKTNAQIQHELQDLCKSYDLYCCLLVCRSLAQLGFKPELDFPLLKGSPTHLRSTFGEVIFNWEEDGTFSILRENRILLRLVPLITTLTSNMEPSEVSHYFEEILTDIKGKPKVAKKIPKHAQMEQVPTVILYPGSSDERRQLPTTLQQRALSLGNDLPEPEKVGFVPVSTYDLGSVERVARALRWSIMSDQILSYPPIVQVPVRGREEILKRANFLQATDDISNLKLLREPEESEYFPLQEYIKHTIGNLKSKGGKANAGEIALFEKFLNDLDGVFQQLDSLRNCPLCGKKSRREEFHISAEDHFFCECKERDCNLIWGTRACTNCHNRFPFMRFNDPQIPEKTPPGWVEETYGMDILAIPCPSRGREMAYICPVCGSCGYTPGRPGCVTCPQRELIELEANP